MGEKYVQIISQAGGKMEFSAFVTACQQAGVDARLWLRVKHQGQLFSWIDANTGAHFISTSPQPT